LGHLSSGLLLFLSTNTDTTGTAITVSVVVSLGHRAFKFLSFRLFAQIPRTATHLLTSINTALIP
jgi:hypothetical protein